MSDVPSISSAEIKFDNQTQRCHALVTFNNGQTWYLVLGIQWQISTEQLLIPVFALLSVAQVNKPT